MRTRLLCLTMALAACSQSFAQTEKGRWLIGTQLTNISYQKQENGFRSIAGSLTPSAGYLVTNGFVVGTGVPLSFTSAKYGDSYANFYNLRQNGTAIGLSPFVRYYIGPNKLRPFVGFASSYSRTTSTYKTDRAGGSESKTRGPTTALTPTVGLAYFVAHNLGLALNISYNVDHVEYATIQTSPYTPGGSSADYNTRSLSVGIGFQIFVGK